VREDRTDRSADSDFTDLGIASKLLAGIDRLEYTTPTPIQRASIPAGLAGKDVIAIARTGSGKTVAFGVPMLQRLAKLKRSIGLILAPTRELALQVDEVLRGLGRGTGIRTAVLIGGASMSLQRTALQKNPRIIVATPGRLMDHIARKTVDLSRVEMLVLDEADRMLDMGFIKDIEKIVAATPESRQTMLFSATMPAEIEAIAARMMDDPVRIEIDRSGTTPTEVSHEMFFVNNHDKSQLLAVQLKRYSGPVLVFTRTKRMASRLTAKVNKMGFAAAEIHSNRTLGQRRRALDGFKQGDYQILVATDIAARGIDVSGIELVVNYDMPANSEDYVHRIGRTGRAGQTGHAISFANADQKSSVRDIEKFMKMKLNVSTLPKLPKLPAAHLTPSSAGRQTAGPANPKTAQKTAAAPSRRLEDRQNKVDSAPFKGRTVKRGRPRRKGSSGRNRARQTLPGAR